MTTFTATVTDSAGQTSVVSLALGDAMPAGSDGTASVTWGVRAQDTSGSAVTALEAVTAITTGLTRLWAPIEGIPASVGAAGDGPAVLRLAAAEGKSVLAACSTTYTYDSFSPASVTAPVTSLVTSMLAAGLTGCLCLDPCPQDDNPSWQVDLGTGSIARAAAARWRAAQRAAARAVWDADLSGRIGYSTTVLGQGYSGLHLDRAYWDPAAAQPDDLPGSLPWTSGEQAKVLLSVSPTGSTWLYADGTFDSLDDGAVAADYTWWNTTAGYTRMGLGPFTYNTDDAYPGGSTDETRLAQLITGTTPEGYAIPGSLGEWVSRKRAAGSLRQVIWDDSYGTDTGGGAHASVRLSPLRAGALSAVAARATALPYTETQVASPDPIASGETVGGATADHVQVIHPGWIEYIDNDPPEPDVSLV